MCSYINTLTKHYKLCFFLKNKCFFFFLIFYLLYLNIRNKIRKMLLACFAFFDNIFGVARVIISLWLLLHIAQACYFKWLGNMIEMPDKLLVKIRQGLQIEINILEVHRV